MNKEIEELYNRLLVRKFENIDISQLANLLKPWYKTWETSGKVSDMLFWKRLLEDFRGQTVMLPKE
jgi:hypothetical protein